MIKQVKLLRYAWKHAAEFPEAANTVDQLYENPKVLSPYSILNIQVLNSRIVVSEEFFFVGQQAASVSWGDLECQRGQILQECFQDKMIPWIELVQVENCRLVIW
jgi:hypothetical protein